MPKVDLASIEGKKTQHPKLTEAKENVGDEKPERIAIEVQASYARSVKAAAKAQGLTIKQFVMQALDYKMTNL